MPRVSKRREISPKKQDLFIDDFYSAVTSLKDKKEVRQFFEDLLTWEEKLMLAKRLQIAMMLLLSYYWEEIDGRVKVTQGTIARVRKKLDYGLQGLTRVAKRIISLKEQKKESFGKRSKEYLGPEIVKAGIGVVVQKRKEAKKRKSITR